MSFPANAERPNTNTGPVEASIANACVHAQEVASPGLCAMSWPLSRKSAALTMTPTASRGSAVLLTNRNRNEIRPSYKFRETNPSHLVDSFCCVVVILCILLSSHRLNGRMPHRRRISPDRFLYFTGRPLVGIATFDLWIHLSHDFCQLHTLFKEHHPHLPFKLRKMAKWRGHFGLLRLSSQALSVHFVLLSLWQFIRSGVRSGNNACLRSGNRSGSFSLKGRKSRRFCVVWTLALP